MKITYAIYLTGLLLLTGCATTSYTLVEPGVQTIGSMRVTAYDQWNAVPSAFTPSSRADARTWTRDGLLLDRIMIIPGVNDGESLFRSRNEAAALPVYRSDMLPNEIAELVESSIVKLYGEGAATVSTSSLRPQGFTDTGGFMFDIEAAVTESPNYNGIVGGFTKDDRLYLVIFLAATPYYYDKHKAAADAVIKSASTAQKTIGFN